ncbi:hypothetical protein ABNN70_14175 [Sporolactobacillus sp. Y61]|uniref:Uncharacterized protein n=1 Tax=Sporolactobacillus sp. Y61 TaxID=3160863 RepID=A0AAU8IEN0_9BACL
MFPSQNEFSQAEYPFFPHPSHPAQDSNGMFPYQEPDPAGMESSTASAFPDLADTWTGRPGSIYDRQPPGPGEGPFERRLRQLEQRQEHTEREINRIQRQQERFNRELNSLDRRLRIIERRLGVPVPPIGGPGRP